MTIHYYNEFNPESAAMLRQMMSDGIIPYGDVDERSITEVQPDELRRYTQCHFFAGIGGWPVALQLAGWPPERPVWTGSAPCQPYSIVGQKQGFCDPRDMWPYFFDLKKQYPDVTLFGEQVPQAVEFGWLDRLMDDMASIKNTVWPVILPACAAQAQNERERLFFVGYPDTQGLERHEWNVDTIFKRALEDRYISTTDICDVKAVECWDGFKRLVKSGIDLLDDGISSKDSKIYANCFGNAINPRIAAEFIKATM